MDSAMLAALRVEIAALAVRVDAALKRLDQLIAADGRRCTDCHRRSGDLPAPQRKCRKCGSRLRDCVELGCTGPAQCGEVWCVNHMPDGPP